MLFLYSSSEIPRVREQDHSAVFCDDGKQGSFGGGGRVLFEM
jgi:hypothetical protein